MRRVEHRPDFVAEIERDRSNPHGRADTGRRLAGQVRGNSSLERGQHLAKTSADAAMRPDERSLGRHQGQVEVRQPLRIDPPVIEQYVA